MKNIRKDLESICQAFKLGKLLNWHSTGKTIADMKEVIFQTEKEKNLKFYHKY